MSYSTICVIKPGTYNQGQIVFLFHLSVGNEKLASIYAKFKLLKILVNMALVGIYDQGQIVFLSHLSVGSEKLCGSGWYLGY